MNLVQAHLAGVLSGPVDCLVLEHVGVGRTCGSRVLQGTREAIAQLCPEISTRHVALHPQLASIRVAQLARNARLDTDGTLLLGIYPSPLWARSPAMESAKEVVLLDDGASSLNLDLSRVFGGRLEYRHRRWLARMVEIAAGPVRLPRASPTIYTCFPVDVPQARVLHHDYGEMRTALRSSTALTMSSPPGRRIWIDSNYSWLSSQAHVDLVKAAVQKFDIDAYVPHRRTEAPLVARISRELRLPVLRPKLPLELLIGSWTRQGASLVTPPTSLVHTAPHFVEWPGQITVTTTSLWLRRRAERAPSGEMSGIVQALDHALLVEQSLQASAPHRIEVLQ